MIDNVAVCSSGVRRADRATRYTREVRRGTRQWRIGVNLIAERAALLRRYRQLRAIMRDLHSELLKSLPKDKFTECGRKLGFQVNGTLVFETEDEASVLADYCLYDGWSGQHNAVTRFLAKQPYPAGSDQALLLVAMSRARYSLFQVESVAEGLGVNCRDILRGDGGTIVDEGLGNTAVPGVIVAGRLVVLPELSMTTGAGLVIDADTLEDIQKLLEDGAQGTGQADFNNLTRQEAAVLPSIIIRCALAKGTPSQGATQELGRGAELRQQERSTARRPSRNEPCPCGSGKKYKRCCGRTEQRGA